MYISCCVMLIFFCHQIYISLSCLHFRSIHFALFVPIATCDYTDTTCDYTNLYAPSVLKFFLYSYMLILLSVCSG